MSRHFRTLLLSFLLLLSSLNTVFAEPPNIVLILADDLGFTDTQPYGSEIPTPNISRLAKEGVMFTNYHTAATCSPSRAMLMTGVDSHRAGVPDIPVSIPPEFADRENYQGVLSHKVVTVATLLKDAGYHTYMTGKWHLGYSFEGQRPDLLPSKRGFERTVALMEAGADNWEQKPFVPAYKQASWYADGKPMDLPEDFYSSKYLIDKAIEFIESNREDNKPFFSYIPFQAVHFPVQAPREYTDKYMGQYDIGWQVLRKQRLQSVKRLGLVPEDTRMVEMPSTLDWNSLSAEQKRYQSKKMAVYAGMVDAMDFHIGRLIAYLKKTGQYDNTIFIFTSDNGTQITDVFDKTIYQTLFMRLWLRKNGYNLDYETLGERGSFINMGISFGSAAASPLAFYKFYAGEGGMRVPMIISGTPIQEKGGRSNAFTFVTDIAPTILDMAGVAQPGSSYRGREVEPMIGKSLAPLVKGRQERVYAEDEAVGFELLGHSALFRGDYKLVRNRGPLGDNQWHLFNIVTDPGEVDDLREKRPELFVDMKAAYGVFAEKNGVLEVPDDYDQTKVAIDNIRRNNRGQKAVFAIAALLILTLTVSSIWKRIRHRGDIAYLTRVKLSEKVIDKTLRPFLVITGLITMAPVLMALSPEAGLMKLFQLKLVAEYTLVVQHWGLMIFIVGLLTVISAFKTSLIFPVLLYSAIEKAGIVFFTFINVKHHYVEGFLQPAGFDLICVIYALLYFHTLHRKRKRKNDCGT